VIRTPDWLPNAPGRYLMYFAHHRDSFIRTAFADRPEGPWTVEDGKCLELEQVLEFGFVDHIASPDVHIDEENRRLVMFFHGPNRSWKVEERPGLLTWDSQATAVAFSKDGLRFQPKEGVLGLPYFRVWRYQDDFYAFSYEGHLFRFAGTDWPDGSRAFEERPGPLATWRHCAVWPHGDELYVFFSRRNGDTPERILCSRLDMRDNWKSWELSEPVEVLRPENPSEGADLPILPSSIGLARGRLHELRDPCVFEDNGRLMLFYSIAGESGISGATLTIST